ncbi:hypothetical protein [Flavobacterium chilense]|uniref:Lipoprotein n=1 Tax=Flavobacterium chilense TaxID=946677 RepID=A0A1M6Y3E1_9FLAO|nr:hypothetical protein [Flavobacterium chilense]SHL12613.1 hypothetical protein SAMN05444484_101391 [Flavobacterium chilense]
MRNLKKLLYLLLCSINLVFVGCTKEQDSSLQETGSIPLTDYGFYHNEALDLYYKKYHSLSGKTAGSVIDEMTTELKTKYPEEFKNVNVDDVKIAFKNIDPQRFDIDTFWNSNKEQLYASGKVSRRLGDLVEKILENNMGYNQCMVEIENFKSNSLSKKGNALTIDEQNSLVVFESVLNSSNQYWNSKSTPTKKATGKPGSKVIVADTMGALMFVYSGPMAIIAGGVCSLFVNEALPPYEVPIDDEIYFISGIKNKI